MWPDLALPDEFWFFMSLAVLLAAWPIYGPRIAKFFDRLEQRRRDAELQHFYDRMNPQAHFRQTLDAINDETAPVEAFAKAAGTSDVRAIWDDRIYATREEADAARWRHVLIRARDFYKDVDRMYGRSVRGRGPRGQSGEAIGSGEDDAGTR
jgi:hypothetical protein